MIGIAAMGQPVDTIGLRPPVPGFVGWWDAADQASISGGIGNTAATWRDKSGNARHLLQSTDASRPWTGGISQAGRNVLATYGKVTLMTGPNGLGARPWTGFIVLAETSGDGVQRTPWVARDIGGGDNRPYRHSSDAVGLWGGDSGLMATQTFERGRPHVLSFAFYGSAGDLAIDGRYRYTGTGGTTPPENRHTVFSMAGGGENWFGWIGELIIYASQLTAPQVARIESYLLAKWGLA